MNANQVLLTLENKWIYPLIKFGAFLSQEMDGKSQGMLESLRAPMEERERELRTALVCLKWLRVEDDHCGREEKV